MTRSGARPAQRAALERKPRRRGAPLFTGLFVGLVAGLVIAAGLAWYLYAQPRGFRSPDEGPTAPKPAAIKPPPVIPAPEIPTEPPAVDISPPPARPKSATGPRPPPQPTETQEPGYSFYDILPGDKPNQPKDMQLPRELWWLQVAALREEKDARALKAKLALLGLKVTVNQVDSAAGPLHRIRVGPFKTEDDALGALDTLAVNNYEPRLFKEKLNP